MKVVALGAGGMGRYAAKTAAGFDFIDEIVVADRDPMSARRLADSLGRKARSVAVDVTDARALDGLFSQVDAVLNTVGPFYRLGTPVLEAAIRNRCHYFDINDDWESTEAMLALDADARDAGITAVIGFGASPGISNLLAASAIAELDSVDEIYPGFDLDAAMPETRGDRPSAATVHGVHQLSGKIRVFDAGRFVDEAPIRRVSLDYPGLGQRTAYTMGHPEAITLPRTFPSLKRALILMTMSRSNLLGMRVLAKLVDRGLLSIERAASMVERLEGVGKPAKTPEDYVRELLSERVARLPPLFAVALGIKNGKQASVGATVLSAPAVGMGGATGVPLAVGLAAVRPDREQRRGVFAPEALVKPEEFFDLLAPLCSPAKGGYADLVLVSRSWETLDLRSELRRQLSTADSNV